MDAMRIHKGRPGRPATTFYAIGIGYNSNQGTTVEQLEKKLYSLSRIGVYPPLEFRNAFIPDQTLKGSKKMYIFCKRAPILAFPTVAVRYVREQQVKLQLPIA